MCAFAAIAVCLAGGISHKKCTCNQVVDWISNINLTIAIGSAWIVPCIVLVAESKEERET